MRIAELLGAAVALLILALAVIFARRSAIIHLGGTIRLAVRLSDRVAGRGWANGLGRFAGEELRWYRTFSFAPRPRRVLRRSDLVVTSRRDAAGPELLALPEGSVILTCHLGAGSPFDIAMTRGAITGFSSWLEAAPPGAASKRLIGPPADPPR